MEFLDACIAGNVEAIKIMLNSFFIDQNIEMIWEHEKSPLHISTIYKRIEIIKILLEDGRFNPNKKHYPGGYTPLMYACISENVEIVKLLLNDFRTDIYITDDMENGISYYSCLFGNCEIVEKIVLDKRFNKEDHKSLYKMYYVACSQNHIQVIKLLMVLIDNYIFKTECTIPPGNSETVNVLNMFKGSPEYIDMRLKYFAELHASDIFYNIVMLSDNYLRIVC
mgnify:CR=1 FL=1